MALFEAWERRGSAEHARDLVQLANERKAQTEQLSRSAAKLGGILSSALARFGGVEVEAPPVAPDPAAARQRRAVVQAEPGKVSRAELAAALNVSTDPRVREHIDRCRELIADEDAQAAELVPGGAALAKLSPYRRERPASKRDTPRAHIHREARMMCAAIVNSRGAYVIQSYLSKLRQIFSGQPLAALRRAALEPNAAGWCRWTYADDGARRRIAIGLMFLVCGRWTNQRTAFGSRSTRRGLVVAGMSVDRILRAVTPVGRRAYDRHTFSSRTGWEGDMAHFERHGFALRKRLPAARCNPWEIGTSGQSKNRYWIGCVVSDRSPKRERRNRRRVKPAVSSQTCSQPMCSIRPRMRSAGRGRTKCPNTKPRAGAVPPF